MSFFISHFLNLTHVKRAVIGQRNFLKEAIFQNKIFPLVRVSTIANQESASDSNFIHNFCTVRLFLQIQISRYFADIEKPKSTFCSIFSQISENEQNFRKLWPSDWSKKIVNLKMNPGVFLSYLSKVYDIKVKISFHHKS